MKTLKLRILAAAVAGMATLIGCESLRPIGPSLVAQHMGEAVDANIAQQTENPNAADEKQSQQAPRQYPSIIQIDAN